MDLAEKPATEAKAETTPAPQTALAPVRAAASGVEGDFNVRDLKLPRINLVQKMSDLTASFKVGSIVFDKTFSLGGPDKPLKATFLRLKKQYQEDLPFGSEIQPRVFNSAKEVYANGGSTTQGDDNFFTEVAHIQVAFEAPEDAPDEVRDLFAHTHNGKDYAMAMITVQKTNYGSLARPLITAAFETLRDGLFNGSFELRSTEKKGPRGAYFVFTPVFKGRHSPEDAAFFQSLLS